jgi:hypothetical protein
MGQLDVDIENTINIMLFDLFFNYMKNTYGLVEDAERGVYICDMFKVEKFSDYAIIFKDNIKFRVSSMKDIENIDKKIRGAKIRQILKKLN